MIIFYLLIIRKHMFITENVSNLKNISAERIQVELVKFVRKVKELHPKKDIWAFTGYIYDKDLVEGGRKYCEATDELLSMLDVLVDGPFIAEQKDLTLKFRGSRNQRVMDMKETLRTGEVVLYMD